MHLYISFTYPHAFIFLEYIFSNRISKSHNKYIIFSIRNCQALSKVAILFKFTKAVNEAKSYTFSLSLDIVNMCKAFLVVIYQYLIVVWIYISLTNNCSLSFQILAGHLFVLFHLWNKSACVQNFCPFSGFLTELLGFFESERESRSAVSNSLLPHGL